MRMVESADGSVQVVELDPTKTHIFILNADQWSYDDLDALSGQKMRDGQIILRRSGAEIAIVEGAEPGTKVVVGGT